jgi:ADP-ribose pyrophosphatase
MKKAMKLNISEAVRNRCVLKGRVFDFYQAEFKNDKKTEYIKHPGAVAAIPVLSDRRIVLVRQWRFAIGEYIWEIPAGTFKKNESVISCLKREVAEETGYCVKRFSKIGIIFPCPGYSDEKIHLFVVYCDGKLKQKPDEDEHLWNQEFTTQEIINMIEKGKIIDGKSLVALLRYLYEERRCKKKK